MSKNAKKMLSRGLMVLLAATACVLVARGQRDTPAGSHTPIQDLQGELPWFHSLLRYKAVRSVAPKAWFLNAEQASDRISRARWAAVAKLGRQGTNAWPHIPVLLGTLDHKNIESGSAAALTLVAIKATEHPAWTEMAEILQGQPRAATVMHYLLVGRDAGGKPHDFSHRRFGLMGLAATGPASARFRPEILAMVQSKDEEHSWRAMALDTLVKIQPEAEDLKPLATRILANPEEWPDVRAAAALALAKAAPADPDVREFLTQTLNDERALVRLGSARALWRMNAPPQELLRTLEPLLSHKITTVRSGALEALAELGPAALPLRARIEDLTADDSETVRHAAAKALRCLSATPSAGLPPQTTVRPLSKTPLGVTSL